MNRHSGSATEANGDDRWVESLLVDFYQSEMPAEFRADDRAPDAVAERPAVRRDRTPTREATPAPRSASAIAAVAVAAACIVLPALAFLSSDGNEGSNRITTPDPEREREEGGPAFELATDDVFLDPAPGTNRPAEMGDGSPETVDVGVGDPEINVPAGALDIEVVPIDEDEKESKDEVDELPEPRDDATLPPEFGVEFD